MRKLQSARDALLASGLGITADDLLTFAEKGAITNHCDQPDRNGDFSITYHAHLIVTDFAGDVPALLFVVSEWLKREQPNAADDAIKFHVDILDHKAADISLLMELTEFITVTSLPEGVRVSPDPVSPPICGFDALLSPP